MSGTFKMYVMTLFILKYVRRSYSLLLLFLLSAITVSGQQNIIVNMAQIDGVNITPDNIFNFQIQPIGGGASTNVLVKGEIHWRNSPLSFSYSFRYTLRPGMNSLGAGLVHPQWQFSSSGLRDLFFTYKTLPEGTYEYCVSVYPITTGNETSLNGFDECLYHKDDDIFLINLIDPEDKSKIQEYNPLLTWVANYSFSNELTYRLRVAEIKKGQNPENALMRNQPVLSESGLSANSLVYPLFGKPLASNQPYAWAVDAYYQGILLGGSEVWQFIIPEDSGLVSFPANRSYIDIKKENGKTQQYAMGQLKIKYILEKFKKDTLSLRLVDGANKEIPLKPAKLGSAYGDNRYILNLKDSASLKHEHLYDLLITSKTGEKYDVPFEYINPDLVK